LIIVNADTVAQWNRERFRRYWARISRRRYPGRPRVVAEIRRLIQQMAQDRWGAPRIHAELTKLGFAVSEITGVEVHAAPTCRARPSEAMDSVLAQPQGRYRRDGSVRRADPRRYGCCTASSSSSTVIGISFTST